MVLFFAPEYKVLCNQVYNHRKQIRQARDKKSNGLSSAGTKKTVFLFGQ